LPAIAFVELRLGELAADPANGGVGDLPYDNVRHLRSVLAALKGKQVSAKIFDRSGSSALSFRTILGGIYVGKADEDLALYSFPSSADLKAKHRDFWKSANL